ILYIALGGALGALSRAGVSHALADTTIEQRFPLATMLVNLAGCFLIGLVMTFVANTLDDATGRMVHALVCTGFLGGLTTFSTFAWQTNQLTSSAFWLAALNVGISVVLGVLLVAAGSGVANMAWKR
ncbi:MAG: CrcB family protein, partial [Planctomycetaceae bacterium]|nr:CrcB family protein [Planctomycetaceae bacterium]